MTQRADVIHNAAARWRFSTHRQPGRVQVCRNFYGGAYDVVPETKGSFMVVPQIPSLGDIGTGMTLIANGACEMASSAVQQFVSSPSIAQAGLHALASQIEALEHLIAQLRTVVNGIEDVRTKLGATVQWEWESPAGQAFRTAVGQRQVHAERLSALTLETAQLARHGVDELRATVAGLQSLLATARASLGDVATAAVGQVCS